MQRYPLLLVVISSLLLAQCAVKNKQDISKAEASAEALRIDSTDDENSAHDTTYLVEAKDFEIERYLEIGAVLPDLEDSTLLTFIYGSCYWDGESFTFNNGPQIWDDQDSVYMKVHSVLGTDSSKIIYIIGEAAITSVMHNHYIETVVAVSLENNGWQITDGYIDGGTIDFQSPEFIGEFYGRLLIKNEFYGTYAGGVFYGEKEFVLLEKDKLDGQSVRFITGSSNGLSLQCIKEEGEDDYHCDCYSRWGKDTLYFDSQLNALVFDYEYTNVTGDCEMENAVEEKIFQRHYMNADTCFMAAGRNIREWDNGFEGEEIKMTGEEIKKALSNKRIE